MVGAQALRVACGLSNQRDRDGDKAAIEFSDEINFLVPVDSKSRPIPQPTFTAPASCLVVMNWGTEHRRQSQVHMCSKPSMFGGCGGWERERLSQSSLMGITFSSHLFVSGLRSAEAS